MRSKLNLDDLADLLYELVLGEHIESSQLLKFFAQDIDSGDKIAKDLSAAAISYIKRAEKLYQKTCLQKPSGDIAKYILDQLPIAILVVDESAQLILSNTSADRILCDAGDLLVDDGKLVAKNKMTDAILHDNIRRMVHRGINNDLNIHKCIQFSTSHGKQRRTALLTPYRVQSRVYTAIIMSGDIFQVDSEILASYFSLSKSETRLVQHLLMGQTLEEYSLIKPVSIHTVRKQLKSVFSKLCIGRQTELVLKSLTSPLLCVRPKPVRRSRASITTVAHLPGTVRNYGLAGARNLEYHEYGEKTGKPIVLFHASLYRDPPEGTLELLHQMNAKLILPLRPGYGNSDFIDYPNAAGWSQDIYQLFRHLDLEKFPIICEQTGSAFAMAFTARYPQLVKKLILVNSPAPDAGYRELAETNCVDRLAHVCVKHFPQRFISGFQELQKHLRRNANDNTKDSSVSVPKEAHSLWDFYLANRYWGVTLSSLHTPVSIWHEKDNARTPVAIAHHLAKMLPNAKLRILSQQGQDLAVTKWDDLIKAALESDYQGIYHTDPPVTMDLKAV